MMRPTSREVTLKMTFGENVDQNVKVDALVAGALCVHPVCAVEGDDVVETSVWCVSHTKTGRGVTGNQQFPSKHMALDFMKLLRPEDKRWIGDNPFKVAALAVPLYQAAVKVMRAKYPDYKKVWRPIPSDIVIVVEYNVRTKAIKAKLQRVTESYDDKVTLDDGLKFTRSKTGAWIVSLSNGRRSKTILCDCSSNRTRFMKGCANAGISGSRPNGRFFTHAIHAGGTRRNPPAQATARVNVHRR